MTTNRRILATSLLLGWAISASITAALDLATDVLVRGEYRPGGTSDDFGWRVTIFENGTVKQQVKTVPGWGAPDEWVDRSTPSLSRRQIQRLRLALEKNRFRELDPAYSADYSIDENTERIITDQSTIVIEASVEKELKRVEIYGPEFVAGLFSDTVHPAQEAGRRFCKVWAEILSVARPPNDWQKAKWYR